jgi:hypothetical protein
MRKCTSNSALLAKADERAEPAQRRVDWSIVGFGSPSGDSPARTGADVLRKRHLSASACGPVRAMQRATCNVQRKRATQTCNACNATCNATCNARNVQHSVQRTQRNVQRTQRNVQRTQRNMQCNVQRTQCAQRNVQCNVHDDAS